MIKCTVTVIAYHRNCELAKAGFDVKEIGESERISPHARTEIVPPEEGGAPIKVTHSGIARVLRYSFPL